MDRLEKYIRDNRKAFDSGPLPPGSRERFMKKMESPSHGMRRHTILAYAAGIAACTMIAMLIGWRTARPVENEYMAMLNSLDAEIIEMVKDYDERTADEITRASKFIIHDTIPLEEQLPDELAPEEKELILKEHYEKKAEGLRRIKENLIAYKQTY